MMRLATKVLFGIGATLTLGLAGCMELPDKPMSDTRQNQLGILCDAELNLVGTFEPGATQPVDVSGCWPVGTWRFTATVGVNRCPDAPRLENEYAFRVTRDLEENENYEYMNDPTYPDKRIKVTSGGGGLCEGGLMIWSEDGKTVWNLKPALYADNTLNGIGEYEIYGEDQR